MREIPTSHCAIHPVKGGPSLLVWDRLEGGVVHGLQRQGDGQAGLQQAGAELPFPVQDLGAGRGELLPGLVN